jgi:hypothetical protein
MMVFITPKATIKTANVTYTTAREVVNVAITRPNPRQQIHINSNRVGSRPSNETNQLAGRTPSNTDVPKNLMQYRAMNPWLMA